MWQGNPTDYMGKAMTWEKGRQLKSYDNVQFTYNASGIRTSKRVGGFVCNYALDGTRILSETGSYHNLIVVYDNEDSVCGIVVNEIPYYFQKNLQGDIIGIVDETGTVVARYTYDAWGACTVVSGSAPIANINPFRYRGYFYDVETGLYYLQSRYYDPTSGRFINGDDTQYTTLSRSKNLFEYCDDAPICSIDDYGCVPVRAVPTGAGKKHGICIEDHYEYNKAIKVDGYIYNQLRGSASKYIFGLFYSSHNGCGWIATYNALCALHNRKEPCDIIAEYEKTGAVLFGALGVQPYAISNFFRRRGYKVTITYNAKKFDQTAKKNTANIIWYLHSKGAHNVLLRWRGKRFRGYNTFSNSTTADDWGTSIVKFLNKHNYTAGMLISIS